MPELPEVETVRRGLALLVRPGTRIARVELRRQDLREPIPRGFARRLKDEPILGFRRTGKFLLWDTPGFVLLSHLGMSGTWRLAPPGDERLHDHCYVHLADGRRLAYRDPRRFGLLGLARSGRDIEHPALAGLGPDPLDPSRFHGPYLAQALAGRRAPIKCLLLDQSIVAGIGNIYAAEALFRVGIRPGVAAGRLTHARLAALAIAVRETLDEAIRAGGSTLRDFRQAGGESGYFQTRFQVYGKEGKPCGSCGAVLRGTRMGGRATAWCPRCQR